METEEIVILVGIIGTGVVIMVLLMWFVSTNNRRIRQRFGESAETSGTIVDIRIERDYHPERQSYEPYVITYSYYDGKSMHEKSFKTGNRKQVHKLKISDRLIVYYDRQKPDDAVAAVQIEWEKSMWWKILIGFAVIIIPAVIATFCLM